MTDHEINAFLDLNYEEPPVNTDADKADTDHAQNVLAKDGLHLVTVLACEESIDGATYIVLARDIYGRLVTADVSSEPGYSNTEILASHDS